MQNNRRNFLKLAGVVAAGVTGGAGFLVWNSVNSRLPKSGPTVSEKHLIIDPDGNKFVYRNGYIVVVNK